MSEPHKAVPSSETIMSMADALHEASIGAICPIEECDYHYQMARRLYDIGFRLYEEETED